MADLLRQGSRPGRTVGYLPTGPGAGRMYLPGPSASPAPTTVYDEIGTSPGAQDRGRSGRLDAGSGASGQSLPKSFLSSLSRPLERRLAHGTRRPQRRKPAASGRKERLSGRAGEMARSAYADVVSPALLRGLLAFLLLDSVNIRWRRDRIFFLLAFVGIKWMSQTC